jgi:hypothetical protein
MIRVEMEIRAFTAIYLMVILSVGVSAVLLNRQTPEEQLVLGELEFLEKWDYITVEFRNVGTTEVNVVEVLLNYHPYFRLLEGEYRMLPGQTAGITCMNEWNSGWHYTITLVTSTGKTFSRIGKAPERHLPLMVEETVWNLTDTTISVIVSNIDMREQIIRGFEWSDYPALGHMSFQLSDISTSMETYNGTSKWDYRIVIPGNQTATFILDWPEHESLVSGKTYFFYIYTETGPDVSFTSKAP